MMLSADFVQSLAPDAASSAAWRKLSGPSNWQRVGQSARALWGECQGSALYQTLIDLTDFASKCSCPSRKFPCKHALGLLFMTADAVANLRHAEQDQDRRIDELGYVQLLLDLWKKRDQLSPTWRAELDAWVGLSEREEDLLANGARVAGAFFVLGATEVQNDRLRERRTWLLDQARSRSYLLLRCSTRCTGHFRRRDGAAREAAGTLTFFTPICQLCRQPDVMQRC